MTPTARSLNLLRRQGWLVAIVERWLPHTKIRVDLFGFADLLGIRGPETVAVQVTTSDHAAARVTKIQNCPAAKVWLESPTRKILVHGWSLQGSRGGRKTWECRIVSMSSDSIVGQPNK